MKMHEKYLHSLSQSADWLTVSEWALKVSEVYPDILAKAELEAANQKNDTTGIREIAARISSALSGGRFEQKVEVDTSERPKRVRFINEADLNAHIEQDLEEDIAPLKRSEIIRRDTESLSVHEQYRIDELENISKQLKVYFGLDFEVDHAQALLNSQAPGNHHPDNLQLLLKNHNGKKHSKNWERFSLDEQIGYLKSAINLQEIVAVRLDVDFDSTILDSLVERLKSIY